METSDDTPRQTLQIRYIKTFPGIVKILQILFSILAFALSCSFPWSSYGGGWVGFVSISGFVHATIWFVLHLFNTVPPIFANYFIELIIYGVFSLFFLTAGIVAASKSYIDNIIGATAVFAFFGFIVFLLDTIYQGFEVFKKWKTRNERKAVPTQEPYV